MIDLGVATSIAKENNYSWQDTVNFALKHNLNTIQFYVTQNKTIPQLKNFSKFNNIYLHLPIDYETNQNALIAYSDDFRKNNNSNKLIIHQKENLSFEKTLSIIDAFNQAGFIIGLENEGSKDLYSYSELIKYLIKSKLKFFAVPDIHRFYFNYVNNYGENEINNEIYTLLNLCKNHKIRIVLHVIDSKSYRGEPEDWIEVFKGIVPYSKLLNYILENDINIESMIFEYETYDYVINSLENLRKID